jgi:hypothetical protein
MKTFSSRQFNQHVGAAKKAALAGPVVITDRGKPTHVLLSVEDYKGPLTEPHTVQEVFASLNAGDCELDIPTVLTDKPYPVDLD